MAKALSVDLRRRVVGAIEQGGHPQSLCCHGRKHGVVSISYAGFPDSRTERVSASVMMQRSKGRGQGADAFWPTEWISSVERASLGGILVDEK